MIWVVAVIAFVPTDTKYLTSPSILLFVFLPVLRSCADFFCDLEEQSKSLSLFLDVHFPSDSFLVHVRWNSQEEGWGGRESFSNRFSADDARAYVGSKWGVSGQRQFMVARHFLELDPSHKLLEVGCGVLNMAQFAIDYLHEGNYACVDPNEELRCVGGG